MEEILACRVCMSTNVKLYDMFKNQLITAYEILTGLEVTLPSKLPTCICGVCSTLLVKCTQFRETCQRTHDLLTFAYQQNHEVSTEYIESLKLNYHPLSNLSLNTVVDAGLSETNASAAALQLNSTDVIRESVKTDSDSAQCELRSVKIEKFHDDEATEEATDDNDFKYEVNIDDSVNVAGKFEKDESTDDELDQSHVDSQFDELFTVKFLTKEQQLEEIQARKMSANYKTSLYKCDKCFKGFMTEATFKNHLGKHEPSSGRYECEICLVRLPTKVSIRDHNARCHEREYTCREAGCSFVVKARSQALAHTKWHNGHVYVCKTCGATFRKRTSHLSHVRLLHPSEHVCLVCGESFIGKRGLLMHGKKMHKQSTENVTTTEDAVFTCDACSVEFRTKDALLKHLAMAVGDCADCKPCVHCGENIGDDCDMKEHVLTHFGRKLCDLTKGLLTYHQRKHTGETPFACTFCPKKYALHEYLKVHLRKHTGETPYPCGECPKKFTDKAALSRHLRVHTGEKPYSCDHCGKSFSQSNSLKVHVQTVHLKQPTPYKSKKRKKPKDINFSTVG